MTWDKYRPGVNAAGKGAVFNPGSAPLLVGVTVGLLGAGCSSVSSGSARVHVWTRLGAW